MAADSFLAFDKLFSEPIYKVGGGGGARLGSFSYPEQFSDAQADVIKRQRERIAFLEGDRKKVADKLVHVQAENDKARQLVGEYRRKTAHVDDLAQAALRFDGGSVTLVTDKGFSELVSALRRAHIDIGKLGERRDKAVERAAAAEAKVDDLERTCRIAQANLQRSNEQVRGHHAARIESDVAKGRALARAENTIDELRSTLDTVKAKLARALQDKPAYPFDPYALERQAAEHRDENVRLTEQVQALMQVGQVAGEHHDKKVAELTEQRDKAHARQEQLARERDSAKTLAEQASRQADRAHARAEQTERQRDSLNERLNRIMRSNDVDLHQIVALRRSHAAAESKLRVAEAKLAESEKARSYAIEAVEKVKTAVSYLPNS